VEPIRIEFELDLDSLVTRGGRSYGPDDEPERPPSVEQVVIDHAADMLLARLVRDRDVYPRLTEQVASIRADLIRERLTPLVEAELARPIQRTDSYGNAQGPSTTLTALVLDEVRSLVSHKRQDTYGAKAPSLLEKIVSEEVGRVFTQEVTEVIKAEKAKAIAAVHASAATIIADAIKRGLGG
jgi:hypothetical protein